MNASLRGRRIAALSWATVPVSRFLLAALILVAFGLPLILQGPGLPGALSLALVSLLVYYLPGAAFLSVFSLGAYQELLLGLPVGFAISSFLIYAASFFGIESAVTSLLVLFGAWRGFIHRRPWWRFLRGRTRSTNIFLLAALAFTAYVNFLHSSDASLLPDGALFFNSTDSAWFCAVARQAMISPVARTPNFAMQSHHYHLLLYDAVGWLAGITHVDVFHVWARWIRMLVTLSFMASTFVFCRTIIRKSSFVPVGFLFIFTFGGILDGYYALRYNLPHLVAGRGLSHYAFTFADFHMHCTYFITGALISTACLFAVIPIVARAVERPVRLIAVALLVMAMFYIHLPAGLMGLTLLLGVLGYLWLIQPRERLTPITACIFVMGILQYGFLRHVAPLSSGGGGAWLAGDIAVRLEIMKDILLKSYAVRCFASFFVLAYVVRQKHRSRLRESILALLLIAISLGAFCLSPAPAEVSLYFLMPLSIVFAACAAMVLAHLCKASFLLRAAVMIAIISGWIVGFTAVALNNIVSLTSRSFTVPAPIVASLIQVGRVSPPQTVIMTNRYDLAAGRENSFIVSCITGRAVLTEGSDYGWIDGNLLRRVRTDNDSFYSGASVGQARNVLDRYAVGMILCDSTFSFPYDISALGVEPVPLPGTMRAYRVLPPRSGPSGNLRSGAGSLPVEE